MKRLLLNIIFAGLTLGIIPQAAAMNSAHSMQLRSRARSNSVGRINTQPECVSAEEMMLKNHPFTESEDHDFANLDAEELDRKRPGSGWRSRIKIWDRIKCEEMYKNAPPAPTKWQLDYYLSSQDKKDLKNCSQCCKASLALLMGIIYIYVLTGLFPECPPLNPTYKEALQINTRYTLNGQPWACTFDSKKYGTVMPIDLELQEIINSNFAFMQLESVKQDGPTCAKYAFANLAAIDQLHRDGKSITAETIAEQMQAPLNTIGLPGQIEWKPLESEAYISSSPQKNSILNYAKIFFPQNNFILWQDDYPNYFRVISQMAIDTIKKHGIAHIYTACDGHATAFSIIKEGENSYRIIYMNTHNTPLSVTHYKECYQQFKKLITGLRKQVTPNQPALTLTDSTKN